MFERLREFLNFPQSRVLQSLPRSGPVLGWTTALRCSGVRSSTKPQQLGDKKPVAEKPIARMKKLIEGMR
jgi:hypothetical protein